MHVWTTHPEDIWFKLEDEKVLYADPNLGPHFDGSGLFENAYEWMGEKYSSIIKRIDGNTNLWWGWSNKIDLRSERYDWRKGKKMVMIHLDIPDEETLMSNFSGYCHGLLNNWFISKNEFEDDIFSALASWSENKHEIISPESAISLEYDEDKIWGDDEWDEYINDLKSSSHELIFQAKPDNFESNWILDDKLSQCNFEFLRLENVISHKFFTGSRKPL